MTVSSNRGSGWSARSMVEMWSLWLLEIVEERMEVTCWATKFPMREGRVLHVMIAIDFRSSACVGGSVGGLGWTSLVDWMSSSLRVRLSTFMVMSVMLLGSRMRTTTERSCGKMR